MWADSTSSMEDVCCFWSVQTALIANWWNRGGRESVWTLQKQHKFSTLGPYLTIILPGLTANPLGCEASTRCLQPFHCSSVFFSATFIRFLIFRVDLKFYLENIYGRFFSAQGVALDICVGESIQSCSPEKPSSLRSSSEGYAIKMDPVTFRVWLK